mmetsp:Transcript_27328/g.26374  ORF Transcript_27328/g.26374 Transcript_27328/m.26374 type:complete len:105 (+) Transcript_27328:421-735(+)
MTREDSILLLLNFEAFDLLGKEKIKREREKMGQFVYQYIPCMKENFTLYNVVINVNHIFKQESFIKGQWIIKEGEEGSRLYLIKSGSCAIYKNVEKTDQFGAKI